MLFSVLPEHTSPLDLANRFGTYFSSKISTICDNLIKENTDNSSRVLSTNSHVNLSNFLPCTEDEIIHFINSSPNKSCVLDPVPTWIVKKCALELAPLITKLINLSFTESSVPNCLKAAIITPILKNATDVNQLKNFRPISNLSFLSKLIERIVASRLNTYLLTNRLHEPMQSAYKAKHSVETALLKIQNDLLSALDKNHSAFLVLLDLSAAFDTVDHHILLDRLSAHFGINGTALKWFHSYLTDRTQLVSISGILGTSHSLSCGVPQGSVLGPILFTLYTSELADIIKPSGINFHMYADDIQLYSSFETSKPDYTISVMEKCISNIRSWTSLKFNDSKTKFLSLNRQGGVFENYVPSIRIGGEIITSIKLVRNLGVTFTADLSLHKHINSICRSASFHLRNIGKIRNYLTDTAAEQLIHAFISSRLDCCNSLLFGLSKKDIGKLQRVQNSAARIVSRTNKFHHITPTLIKLHWLPIEYRITFKILTLTHHAYYGTSPDYVSDMIRCYNPPRCLRSESHHLLQQNSFSTKTFGQRSFESAAPILWNDLPMNIRNCDNFTLFKSLLKTHLFKIAYVM